MTQKSLQINSTSSKLKKQYKSQDGLSAQHVMKDCNSTESSMKTTQNKELRIRYKGHPLHLATINLKQIQNTNSVTKNLEQSQHTAMPEAVYFKGRLIKDIEPKLGPSA